MLEVSLLGVGSVLRLPKGCVVNGQMTKARNEYPPPRQMTVTRSEYPPAPLRPDHFFQDSDQVSRVGWGRDDPKRSLMLPRESRSDP